MFRFDPQLGKLTTGTPLNTELFGEHVSSLISKTSGESPVVYERTIFFDKDTGNNETAIVNDPTHPWGTLFGAITWASSNLAPTGATTLRLLTDSVDGIDGETTEMDNVLNTGLTIMSHSPSSVRTILGTVWFGRTSNPGVMLNLQDINITTLERERSTDTANVNAGTITASGTVVIGQLNIRGADGANGSDGAPGGSEAGATGAKGANGDPPSPGDAGGSPDMSGQAGQNRNGNPELDAGAGYNLTLLGVGTIVAGDARGGNGGTSGNGGDGGIAAGGTGGEGGDSTALVLQDGGQGGSGGDAYANGGNTGQAGFGGHGGYITNSGGWTITSFAVSGGNGGIGGSGGVAGTANAGSGGNGGTGTLGGSTGMTGPNGNATANSGNNGTNGDAGADGSLT